MKSSEIIDSVREGRVKMVEETEYYGISECVVREYPAATFLVRTSRQPIDLGKEMLPFMDTSEFWKFVMRHKIQSKADSPKEVYLFNWVDKAQGPMIFDVGIMVDGEIEVPPNDKDYVLKKYGPLKVASIIYRGPFPHQKNSGWQRIHWEERAKEKGLKYTETLYRELYHHYDFENNQHITEIQIEIE